MTAAPGEYRQLDPDEPAPELVRDLALWLGCTEHAAATRLMELRGRK